ncbi:hypothetical protein DCO58_03460 [Helicobacter saguini]|uniref:Uncharacterized protein n=1 Tax=Helicobacter saguini TaxID=1548018 RepID=A0A347VSB7_9HELI|nr:hypothetical protein [Helicobacter saguini]MWV62571.1 hypothetical protein [Helicobacter saguini]MWV66755.1 hypothetical protein [Helicobacter saguini]MWV69106.1 hypothetical protein [Helicobacter saguini]MWV71339.1 hypothetical protein [Helicobacter saguini]TLD91537.1 hypothetical protein LS64_011835 [Helicobacter saguini]
MARRRDLERIAIGIGTGMGMSSVLGGVMGSKASKPDFVKSATKQDEYTNKQYIAVWETEDARINGEPPHHYEWRIERDTDW